MRAPGARARTGRRRASSRTSCGRRWRPRRRCTYGRRVLSGGHRVERRGRWHDGQGRSAPVPQWRGAVVRADEADRSLKEGANLLGDAPVLGGVRGVEGPEFDRVRAQPDRLLVYLARPRLARVHELVIGQPLPVAEAERPLGEQLGERPAEGVGGSPRLPLRRRHAGGQRREVRAHVGRRRGLGRHRGGDAAPSFRGVSKRAPARHRAPRGRTARV